MTKYNTLVLGKPTCDMFMNRALSEHNGKLNSEEKSLTKQQILMNKTAVYRLVYCSIAYQKQQISGKRLS